MKLPTLMLAVWRFVARCQAPTTARQVDSDAATRELLVLGHESADSVLKRLARRGFLARDCVRGTPRYWVSAGCRTPDGEHKPTPYAHPAVASTRTDAARQPGTPRVITPEDITT